MFGLSLSHILIIAAIALVVLGPEKFPEFAKIALRAFRDLRGYVDDIKREMAEELNPVKNELTKLAQFNTEDYIAPITEALSGIEADITAETKTTTTSDTSDTSDTAVTAVTEEANTGDDDPQEPSEVVSEDPYAETTKPVSEEQTENVGSFSEGHRFPEPTPGGEPQKDSEPYPD